MFGLAVATVLGLSALMVARRAATGLDVTGQTDGGQLLVAVTGSVVGGFVVGGFVVGDPVHAEDEPLLLVPAEVLATGIGLSRWRRQCRHRRTA